MKTIYIPKGETIRYESLATEHLVVHGCLQVTCGITAKTITGYGTVHAGTVNADVIRVDDMDAGSIVCKRLLAKRVQSPEVFASESAAVSCFLSSAYVETGKLTVKKGGLPIMQYRPVQFPTGEVRATTAALANVSKEKLIRLVNRHIRGDWGDTYMADQKANEQAIRDGERILSWYQISGKIRILIITEADRSATTIMLSDEY